VNKNVQVGDVVAERELDISRDRLVRYAGASGDFNPIHYRDDIAERVGLEGVFAHGMLTMGVAVSPITEWLGSDGYVSDYQSRFTRPVVVDPDEGARVSITGTVATVEENSARIDLKVTFRDKTVLGKAQVVVTFHK
jgi:acyl dehydratase